jgi:hypothetical protein
LAAYDIQYNLNGGGWIDWINGTIQTNAEFLNAVEGNQYCFRSRGIDHIGNVEVYPDGRGDTCISAIKPDSGVDLYVENLAFTQGIQTPGNNLPLIEGKPLLVRASLASSPDTPTLSGVSGLLHVSRNGLALPGSPLSSLESTTVIPDPGTDSDANLLEFLLPNEWLTGTLEVYVEIDTKGTIAEVDEGNNRYPANGFEALSFTPLPDLELTIVPITWQRGEQILSLNSGELLTYLSALQRIFPSANLRVTLHNTYHYQGAFIDWEALLSEIDTLREMELPNPASNQKYLGLVPFPADYGEGQIGLAYQPGSSAIVFVRPEHELDLARHLAYTFGLREIAGCGAIENTNPDYPYINGIIQYPGWDYAGDTFVPSSMHDLMAGCQNGWISDYTYRMIYEQLVQAKPILAAYKPAQENIQLASSFPPDDITPLSITAPDAVLNGSILVTGRIAPDGSSGALDQAFRLSDEISLAQSHLGEFRVALTDKDGHETYIRAWTARATNIPSGGEQHFALIFPGQTDLGAVRMYYQEQLLDELIPGSPPTVTIISSPSAGLSGESYTLAWSAAPPGVAMVRYSPDTGLTWKTLATDISGTSYQVDLATLAGTTNGTFEVIVSTGLESASARLTGFSVANQPPEVRIFTPQPGTVSGKGSISEGALVLSGSAFDLEDGLITPGQLTWISDQDGVLGTGYTLSTYLSPGMHQITLQMIDSRGTVGKDIRAINGWRVFLPTINK